MGYWQFLYLITFFSFVHGKTRPESLDNLLHSYANTTLSKHRTGNLYDVILPSKFSGMELSVVRLRSSTFWTRGTNFRYFNVAQKALPMPYTKRLAIVYNNLGNWSSYYFQPPKGYSFVGHVVGFVAYNATNTTSLGTSKLKIKISHVIDPISINFTSIMKPYDANLTPSCVKFNSNGLIVISANLTKSNLCFAEESGHFSVVIPSTTSTKHGERWRTVGGFVGGLFGLIFLFVVVVMIIFRHVRKMKIRRMEHEAEKHVALNTIYIGRSAMPCAEMIRTQPTIEDVMQKFEIPVQVFQPILRVGGHELRWWLLGHGRVLVLRRTTTFGFISSDNWLSFFILQ